MPTLAVENPPSFHVKTECDKAAFDNGFRVRDGWGDDGWGKFRSSTAKGAIWLAGGSMHGPWFLAVERPDIVAELGLSPADMPGPGRARYAFDALDDLYRAIRWGEGEKLYELFKRSRRIRREIIEAGQDTAAPGFGRR